jgi:transketolase
MSSANSNSISNSNPYLLANAVRALSIDAVERAQSGHPGMPLGMADIATVLWQKFLKHNPKNPLWFNRDRFVLSNGHGSMLLYSLLHLTGYALTLEDLKLFRQLHSKTPGHPEYGETVGVETTTGPLAQGLGNAVGMALAEKVLGAEFNQDNNTLVDHFTYVFLGDGCLMEGLSHEVASLAGTLKLGKLIAFYDDNGISIDGPVDSWFSDDTAKRFEAYHWQVIGPIDGHNVLAVEEAIIKAQNEVSRPSLIICKTIIGFASPMAGSEKTHGAPLGAEGVAAVRARLDWPYPPFVVPENIYAEWNHIEQGVQDEAAWLQACAHYQKKYPDKYAELLRRINGDLPDDWEVKAKDLMDQCLQNSKAMATRKCSQMAIEHFASFLPEMFGGSADLTGSNNTDWSKSKPITQDNFLGNYLHYGVREFGMAAMMNGMARHGGFIPYGGTFLVFADYARNAIRLSALMKQRVIYVLSHDSIGLGEDGPTHQPVEHAAMLRLTPNLNVWRPADLVETAVAWKLALENHLGPTALLLSRQNLPALTHNAEQISLIERGGYIIYDCASQPDVILLATGSEVSLAVDAALEMQSLEKDLKIRVVSMPCPERFLASDAAYQEKVLPNTVRKRIAIEALATNYWYRFVGLDGKVIGLNTFGVSAPATQAFDYFEITVGRIIAEIKKIS